MCSAAAWLAPSRPAQAASAGQTTSSSAAEWLAKTASNARKRRRSAASAAPSFAGAAARARVASHMASSSSRIARWRSVISMRGFVRRSSRRSGRGIGGALMLAAFCVLVPGSAPRLFSARPRPVRTLASLRHTQQVQMG